MERQMSHHFGYDTVCTDRHLEGSRQVWIQSCFTRNFYEMSDLIALSSYHRSSLHLMQCHPALQQTGVLTHTTESIQPQHKH